MFPIPNHIYHCKWENEDVSYTNVVLSVDTSRVYGYCINDTDPDNPCSWRLSSWTNQDNSITDLGHIDNFPELLI